MEVAVCVLAGFLASKWIAGLAENNQKLIAAAHALDKEPDLPQKPLPFQKLFDLTNPLQRTAFWSLIALTVLRLSSFIIGDVAYSIFFSISYTFLDVLVLLVYAVILIFIPSFCGYLLSLACIKLAERQNKKAE